MNNVNIEALRIARELTKSKLESSSIPADKASGKCTAEFFQEIYNKVIEILGKN